MSTRHPSHRVSLSIITDVESLVLCPWPSVHSPMPEDLPLVATSLRTGDSPALKLIANCTMSEDGIRQQ